VSLRLRVLSLVLAATLLPMLAMVWLLLQNRADTISRAHGQLTSRVEAIASDLDDRVSGTAQLLFGLGRVPLVGQSDKVACSAFLADVLQEHPQYTGLLTILPNGQLHCDSLKTGRVLNLSDRGYFQRALQSKRYVVEPAIGRLTGKGVLQIAYPVREPAGSLRYVLLASLNLDDFGRAVAAKLPYERMNFQIWGDDGKLVMDYPGNGAPTLTPGAPEKAFVWSDQTSQLTVLGDGAAARIWTATSLPRASGTGLRLALSVPQADLLEREELPFKRALAWLLPFSVLILGVAVAWGELALRRPTTRLMAAIARLDQGNFHELMVGPYPKGELGAVMAAVDRTAMSLAQQRVEIERSTEALRHQASTDALTGLANRHLLTDRLNQALIYAHRAHRVAGVLVLDLDRFKTVNDSLGHNQGDVLLQTVAQRLLTCVRDGDTVARLGGG